MASETSKGYPYPEASDPADVPSDIAALASAVDLTPGIASLTQTEINALSVGDKWAGRVVWNETTTTLQVSNGSSFSDVDTARALATSTPGDVVATGSVGVSTDVARSDHVHGVASSLMLTGEWSTDEPTFANLTLGNGTAQMRYTRFGQTVVATVSLVWGSTTSASGYWRVDGLPIQPNQDLFNHVGTGYIWDSNTGTKYVVAAVVGTGSSGRIDFYSHNTFNLDATTPITWATGDSLVATVIYEADEE